MTNEKKELTTEVLIEKYLQMIGIPHKNKSYEYFKEAIIMYLNKESKSAIDIYKKIAKKHGVADIQSTMRKQLRDVMDWTGKLENIFGYMVSENYVTPKNEEFIALIAERVNLDMQITDEEKIEEREVIGYLHMLGIPVYLNGYKYLIEAIIRCKKEMLSPTKELYQAIAKKYNTTPAAVERLIRCAIITAWNINRMDIVNEIFGSTISPDKGNPTSSEFIKTIAYYIMSNK